VRVFLGLAPLLAVCLFVAGCGGSSGSGSGSRAAVINGNDVPLRLYQVAFQNARLQSIDANGYDPCQVKTSAALCGTVKAQAMQSVIQAEIIREYAATHHISVPPGDVNRQWQIVYRQRFDNRADVLQAWIKHVYSNGHFQETAQDLKNGIEQNLLQQKVIYAVVPKVPTSEPGLRLAVIEAANGSWHFVHFHLVHGEDFLAVASAVAANKTSECAALKCGELGWVPNDLVAANRKQLLTAPAGSTVGPYKGQLVFEIYKVEARVPDLPLTARQQYLVRVNRFTIWLSRQESRARITRYVAA
jgi:hypothetical protein